MFSLFFMLSIVGVTATFNQSVIPECLANITGKPAMAQSVSPTLA